MPLMGSEDLQNLLKFAYTLCSRALLRLLCLRCYGFEQQQRSSAQVASRSCNRTAVCE